VSGEVYIDVPGVTLQGFKIHGGSSSNELLLISGDNAVVQDSEIRGESNTTAGAPGRGLVENYGSGLVLRRNNMFNSNEDGIRLAESQNITIRDNYLHDWVRTPTNNPHCDGIVPGESSAGPWAITHNTILMWSPGHMTSVLSFEGVPGKSVGPMTITDNVLAGGGFVVSGGGDTNYTGITFTKNRFSTVFSSNSGTYGLMNQAPKWGTKSSFWGGTGQENVWHDGANAGKTITAP
jgi:parallel beta-helix repeat protein